MRVLLITAMKKEYHCAREISGAIEIPFYPDFRLAVKNKKSIQIHILQCGFQVEEALNKYMCLFTIPDILVDSGTCASLNPDRLCGTVYNSIKVLKEDSKPLYYDEAKPDYKLTKTSIIEVSSAINDEDKRKVLAKKADLCSMESYTLCRIAQEWNILHYSFRVVSDFANSQMETDFKKNFRKSCRHLYGFIFRFLNDFSH